MRKLLIVLLLSVTAFQAAAQFPVKTVTHFPSVLPSAEIHFMDGNINSYPIKRISKDLIRVDTGDLQSIRIPLTFVESIHFKDGCTLFFENGQFQFDKLISPARLKNESGDALLEGVLQLDMQQTASLMGPDLYPQFRKNSRLLKIGVGTLATGCIMTLPYFGAASIAIFHGESPGQAFKEMSPFWKGITIGGGSLLLAGITMAVIGNANCNRIAATYNNGLGVAYTF